ncbi:flagellar basal body P-ring formation chaperone FlgA [Pantoea sp. B65]|uniref:flagellar basal body P-ring formation chaperone FlgA n=1 Tax=Pantoea sp. B65 TaxID=2813359 RepID=UPI0039B63F47
MRRVTPLLAGLFGLLSLHTDAADLTTQLTQFFKARDATHAENLTVVLRTPAAQWPQCDTPQFFVAANSRQWGMISVAANCGQERRYLQVQVQVTGDYVVTSRQVARGSALKASDLSIKHGRLDVLPARVIVDPQQIVEAISIRDITPGQPLTLSMVRQPWRVKAGQNVIVIAQGNGFNATSEGRAMNNATATQPVRVRMGNGQIVSGKVDADGNILISL